MAHFDHTATLLADGKVLVVGGLINDRLDGWVLASAELYDPDSWAWTATAEMIDARWSHRATLLQDGRVLVAGGYLPGSDTCCASSLTAEVYDPDTGQWTTTGGLIEARAGHASTPLLNGKVLVVGGRGNSDANDGLLATAELYDPESGQWTATERMAETRDGRSATLLLDGRVLVTGDYHDESRGSTELYDPNDGI